MPEEFPTTKLDGAQVPQNLPHPFHNNRFISCSHTLAFSLSTLVSRGSEVAGEHPVSQVSAHYMTQRPEPVVTTSKFSFEEPQGRIILTKYLGARKPHSKLVMAGPVLGTMCPLSHRLFTSPPGMWAQWLPPLSHLRPQVHCDVHSEGVQGLAQVCLCQDLWS